jgi:hypothetical protein
MNLWTLDDAIVFIAAFLLAVMAVLFFTVGVRADPATCAQLRVADAQNPVGTLSPEGKQVRAVLYSWYVQNCKTGPIGPRKQKSKPKP